ncbi:PssD/Cps14F family polysaccharide biosynthesis glycosyltransferase [Guptibacillus hwajinpoensis]|uniref:PssD/Cps14F family polysaccharide biosynthesis glycosyltransferase n=1 Tax=Guptibacillus hwajinpoensis TaxID=208199 RepID=UPI001CFEADDD|nr:PssD/Cps14F family polysaccharide biosynthesis glycosyltransferase [Pseudalkalibacillus hwajinpoensis]WLR61560.1 PssD/Cps14F family polysaccharide biosynthesis glycosyltransferase [Pseudalkalibacillus hwajinpoensis]
MKQKLKVCLASSAGGHLSQLKELIPVANNYDSFIVTEKNITTKDLKGTVKFLTQQDRKNPLFPFQLIKNLIRSIAIIIYNKPDIIISTGAGAIIPLCILGKLFGSKIIFIESFAKVSSPTITGRVIYLLADQFYVQWEGMLNYYPKAKFKGTIY